MRPPNTSGDPRGYNTSMFNTDRAVKTALRRLGYGVSPTVDIPGSTILRFQHDYNKCADRFGKWGKTDTTSMLDKHTLNAIETALRWSEKSEKRHGTPSANSWQSLCKNLDHLGCGKSRRYSAAPAPDLEVSPDETRYVEILPNGNGKLRSTASDRALRANVMDYERHGDVIFAVVVLPPQDGLPGGRDKPFKCPCVLR